MYPLVKELRTLQYNVLEGPSLRSKLFALFSVFSFFPQKHSQCLFFYENSKYMP